MMKALMTKYTYIPLWVKLAVGGTIGILLGVLVSPQVDVLTNLFLLFSDITIKIGRYAIFLLLFFGVIVGISEIESKEIFVIYGRTLGLICAVTAGLILIGVLSIFILSPANIPLIYQEAPQIALPNLLSLIQNLFPHNALQIFTNTLRERDFFLPLFLFAGVLGYVARLEMRYTGTLISFADSMSRILYRFVSFIFEIIAVGMIALGVNFVFQLQGVSNFSIFFPLVIVLIFDVVFIIFGVFPLIVRLLNIDDNPFSWIGKTVAPFFAGFFSGDMFFAISALTVIGKKDLMLNRRIGSSLISIAALFARGGTALVTSATFIIILQSYSALEITFLRVLWVMLVSFGISFLVGATYGSGLIVSLAMVANLYGRGLSDAYLIILPISALLIAIATFLDIGCASFITYVINAIGQGRVRQPSRGREPYKFSQIFQESKRINSKNR